MNYQVHITKTAEHDIAKAADYVEFVLKNPQAADHLLDVATEKIGELTQMLEKLQLVDDPVLAGNPIYYGKQLSCVLYHR